jgi:hypothetical protein
MRAGGFVLYPAPAMVFCGRLSRAQRNCGTGRFVLYLAPPCCCCRCCGARGRCGRAGLFCTRLPGQSVAARVELWKPECRLGLFCTWLSPWRSVTAREEGWAGLSSTRLPPWCSAAARAELRDTVGRAGLFCTWPPPRRALDDGPQSVDARSRAGPGSRLARWDGPQIAYLWGGGRRLPGACASSGFVWAGWRQKRTSWGEVSHARSTATAT